MRTFFLIFFVVSLVVVAFETFRPQPKLPALNTTSMTGQARTAAS